jgi:hypothetical protein
MSKTSLQTKDFDSESYSDQEHTETAVSYGCTYLHLYKKFSFAGEGGWETGRVNHLNWRSCGSTLLEVLLWSWQHGKSVGAGWLDSQYGLICVGPVHMLCIFIYSMNTVSAVYWVHFHCREQLLFTAGGVSFSIGFIWGSHQLSPRAENCSFFRLRWNLESHCKQPRQGFYVRGGKSTNVPMPNNLLQNLTCLNATIRCVRLWEKPQLCSQLP